jgi:hypothetical protein
LAHSYSTCGNIRNMGQYLVLQCIETPGSLSSTVHDKHQKYVLVSSCRVYCTTRYWHIFLMFLRVLYNYILAHISDVSSCTLQLDTVRYFYSKCRNIRNMCQYLIVELTMKHEKYVPVYSCRVHDETSEIYVTI